MSDKIVNQQIRFALCDEHWDELKNYGPPGRLEWGAAARPPVCGPWQTVYSTFRAWIRNGLWSAILAGLSRARDDEYLMIDSTAVRVHAHGANPAGGQLAQAIGRSRASLSTKIHLACDALG